MEANGAEEICLRLKINLLKLDPETTGLPRFEETWIVIADPLQSSCRKDGEC